MGDLLNNLFSNVGVEIIAAIGTLLITSLIPTVGKTLADTFLPQLRQRFKLETPEVRGAPKSYKEQMAQLTQSLVEASAEVDQILQEMTRVSQQRESTITKLEQQLEHLSAREKQAQQRVEALEKVPLPAVEAFASMLEKGEKRSAWRDYALFGLGVIVSTIVAIILGRLGF